MGRDRRLRAGAIAIAIGVLFVAAAVPIQARSVADDEGLTAFLDGEPIDPVKVGNWYCHDFEYPAIQCFSDPRQLNGSAKTAMAAASVTYLTVYEFTTYQGAFMHMSENYSMLSLIGWNDRISSFAVKNGQSGAFWTDWLYSGTRYGFCCNSSLGSLGGYNDTFSSVFHN